MPGKDGTGYDGKGPKKNKQGWPSKDGRGKGQGQGKGQGRGRGPGRNR